LIIFIRTGSGTRWRIAGYPPAVKSKISCDLPDGVREKWSADTRRARLTAGHGKRTGVWRSVINCERAPQSPCHRMIRS